MDKTTENLNASDTTNGYEAVATEFMQLREQSAIGAETVQLWARSLDQGVAILDLGCGSGFPIATTLSAAGFNLYGIDASAQLTQVFSHRLPAAYVASEAIEDSTFFNRKFDAVIAIGLMFLLPAEQQRALIHKVAAALNPKGRFLFTAPVQNCNWTDVLTGHESRSLGFAEYQNLCSQAGLGLVAEYEDEGKNHYYDMRVL
ncbi:MAG: class I SAM-dependent methyltransferase [Pararheinheimera sp.]|nr:class I SAM-dependent methyltransferase [Rheinheimera sp.]